MNQKTEILQYFSYGVFVSDFVYTLEYYSSYSSADDSQYFRAYVTRWDFQDPMNPVVLARGRLAGDHISGVREYFNVQDDELINVIGGRIISTDLSAPDLDRSVVKMGVGNMHGARGMLRTENCLVFSSLSGALHVFKDQQPDGPDPVSYSGGGQIDVAMTENYSVELEAYVPNFEDPIARVYDISDPFNPEEMYRIIGWYPFYIDCAISTSCAVLFDPTLHVTNLESGVKASSPISVNDFVFVQPFIGVLVNEDGLSVVDITDPTDLVILSNPWTQALSYVGNVPGNPSLVAVCNAEGDLQIWNLDVPEVPMLVGSFASGIDAISHQNGSPGGLLTCLNYDHEGWPGTTLQLVDVSDPSHPSLAGSLRLPGVPFDTWYHDSLLYMVCEGAGLIVVDVSNPMDPFIHGGLGTDPVQAVMIDQDRLLLGGQDIFVLPLDESTLVPVMVTDFSAIDNDGVVNLQWRLFSDELPPEFRVLRFSGGAVTEFPAQGSGEVWNVLDTSPKWGDVVYRLECRMNAGDDWISSGEITMHRISPLVARLLQPSPNPFNPKVELICELPRDGSVRIRIFDITGRVVRVLFDGFHSSGRYSFTWDGTDSKGRLLSSGTYVAELNSSGNSDTRKLQLVR